eukprot:CAMPEP_0173393088 /NCGR_PEP_ID=MMETSP1356-20130122/21910_1 /TAXON_ID=77927 ORGANISM="Hemiselmis virescens, Strain PCC157" /NCGR_SAMPLE_ID=MMETSP1356 /ASSEMBLY_ACC=CAM_ASM_000847 /LENGTH=62 /DNA_ID=CAMNT_0014351055 /DNA_START=46 /DNA_END=230 /DNA_ORIENTATION=+
MGSQQEVDEIVRALADMGFPENNAKKAVLITGATSAETAAMWLIDHGDELDQMQVPGEEQQP